MHQNFAMRAARWQPGMPVITAQDRAEWMAWRHDRALTLQRGRRKRLRRIDYYPSEQATALIEHLRTPRCGGDASSILNRIVSEWAACQRSIPEFLASLNAKAAEQ